MSIVIGAFYELPDGRIARTYGWGGKTEMVSFYFDNDKPRVPVHVSETVDWKIRRDLSDFPNARDPLLPYSFDLHWDIKHRSELLQVLGDGDHDDIDEIRAMVREHKIDIDPELLQTSSNHSGMGNK